MSEITPRSAAIGLLALAAMAGFVWWSTTGPRPPPAAKAREWPISGAVTAAERDLWKDALGPGLSHRLLERLAGRYVAMDGDFGAELAPLAQLHIFCSWEGISLTDASADTAATLLLVPPPPRPADTGEPATISSQALYAGLCEEAGLRLSAFITEMNIR